MRKFRLGTHALSGGVAIALLAGCGGASRALPVSGSAGPAALHSATFTYTGAEQSFNVPPGVTELRVTAQARVERSARKAAAAA